MSADLAKGLLRLGRGGACIVADGPFAGPDGCADVDFYGGHMVAESVTIANAWRLIACWNACADMRTEVLEDDGVRKLREDRNHLLTEREVLLMERDGLLQALKAAETILRYVPDFSTNWLGQRPQMTTRRAEALVQSAIASASGLNEPGRIPPEAAAIGAQLDAESIEQGEPA